MRKIFAPALILLFSIVCNAQQFYTPPPVDYQKTGTLAGVFIDVTVKDGIATTTLDLHFKQRENRFQDEGVLEFSLLPHQHLSQFKLDVNGTLRDAVVVEKQKGRIAYEEIISRRVDPGLLEMIGENRYRLRVYPILNYELKRAVLVYEEKLLSMGDGYIYTLPLGYDYPKSEGQSAFLGRGFNLRMTVPKTTLPTVKENPFDNFQFTAAKAAFEAFARHDSVPEDVLTVSIPASCNTPELLLEKTKVDNGRAFVLHATSQLQPERREIPLGIALYVDRSLSMQPVSRNILTLIERYIKTIKNKISVDLYTIGCDIQKVGDFEVCNGDVTALFRSIEQIEFDGVVRLDSLDLTGLGYDQVWLITDGISPGVPHPFCKTGIVPVMIMNDNKLANTFWMKELTEKTGGVYIDLKHPVADPLELLTTKIPHLVGVEHSPQQVDEVYIQVMQHNDWTKSYLLTGRQKKNNARLILHFGLNNNVLRSDTLFLSNSGTGKYDGFVERSHVNNKVKYLNATLSNRMKEVTDVGMKYSLVSPNTSLIVLETIEDYIKYEIVPPTDKLRTEYFTNLERIKREEQENSWKKEEALKEKFNDRRMAWTAFASKEGIEAFDRFIEKRRERREWAEDRRQRRTAYWEEVERQRRWEEWKQANPQTYSRPKKCKKSKTGFAYSNTVTQSGILLSESPTRKITGRIVDQFGEEVIGCGVYVKGTTAGTYTDIDGKFSLTLPEGKQKVTIAFIGMKTIKYVPTHTEVKVVMEDDVVYLEETVVVGYGVSDNTTSEPAPIQQEPIIKDQEVTETTLYPLLPDSVYLDGLKALPSEEILRQYTGLKQIYGANPFFYLSVADLLRQKGNPDAAYQVVSNLAEMSVNNTNLQLPYAKFILQLGYIEEAIGIFESNLLQYPDRLINYRELALAYAAGERYQEAIDCMYSTIAMPFDDEDKVMLFTDMNNLISKAKRENRKLKLGEVDSKFIFPITAGQRLVAGSFSDAQVVLEVDFDRNIDWYEYKRKGGIPSLVRSNPYAPVDLIYREVPYDKTNIVIDDYNLNRSTDAIASIGYLEVYTDFGTENEKKKIVFFQCTGRRNDVYRTEIIN